MAKNENPESSSNVEDVPLWFCVKSQPKHEHIAAAHLRKIGGLEVFLPRIRFKRAGQRGAAWATEALFPGYLFARFHWLSELRQVHHAHGVRGVVRFGNRWPSIPDQTVQELRQSFGDAELCVVGASLAPGDRVQVATGTFRGLRAVIARVMPGRERIAVLMEFLGRQTMIELPVGAIVVEGDKRREILSQK